MKDFHKKHKGQREEPERKKSITDELESLRKEIRGRKSKTNSYQKNKGQQSSQEKFKDTKKGKFVSGNKYEKKDPSGKFEKNFSPKPRYKSEKSPGPLREREEGNFDRKKYMRDKRDKYNDESFSSKKNFNENKSWRGENKNFEKKLNHYKEKPSEPYSKKKQGEEGKRHSKPHSSSKENPDLIRLNKYISNSGICSRRDADNLIASGKIFVNNKVVTELGYKVKKDDEVKYNNKVLFPEKMTYLLLNKPKDYITTTEDPENRKTIMELVEGACPERIYPVGRLDRNTTGLIMLTNDGELADRLAHPSNNIKKIYQVDLDKPLTTEHLEQIKNGLLLDDGQALVDDIEVLSKDRTILGVEIHIGRNRIVRRIFEHLGYEVVRLDRVMYAGLTKKDLPRGKYRFLTEKEVINLKYIKK